MQNNSSHTPEISGIDLLRSPSQKLTWENTAQILRDLFQVVNPKAGKNNCFEVARRVCAIFRHGLKEEYKVPVSTKQTSSRSYPEIRGVDQHILTSYFDAKDLPEMVGKTHIQEDQELLFKHEIIISEDGSITDTYIEANPEEFEKTTIRLIKACRKDLDQTLQNLPQDQYGLRYGLIYYTHPPKKPGIYTMSHVTNFYVDQQRRVYYIDVQDYAKPEGWIQKTPSDKGYIEDLFYLPYIDKDFAYQIKKEPLDEDDRPQQQLKAIKQEPLEDETITYPVGNHGLVDLAASSNAEFNQDHQPNIATRPASKRANKRLPKKNRSQQFQLPPSKQQKRENPDQPQVVVISIDPKEPLQAIKFTLNRYGFTTISTNLGGTDQHNEKLNNMTIILTKALYACFSEGIYYKDIIDKFRYLLVVSMRFIRFGSLEDCIQNIFLACIPPNILPRTLSGDLNKSRFYTEILDNYWNIYEQKNIYNFIVKFFNKIIESNTDAIKIFVDCYMTIKNEYNITLFNEKLQQAMPIVFTTLDRNNILFKIHQLFSADKIQELFLLYCEDANNSSINHEIVGELKQKQDIIRQINLCFWKNKVPLLSNTSLENHALDDVMVSALNILLHHGDIISFNSLLLTTKTNPYMLKAKNYIKSISMSLIFNDNYQYIQYYNGCMINYWKLAVYEEKSKFLCEFLKQICYQNKTNSYSFFLNYQKAIMLVGLKNISYNSINSLINIAIDNKNHIAMLVILASICTPDQILNMFELYVQHNKPLKEFLKLDPVNKVICSCIPFDLKISNNTELDYYYLHKMFVFMLFGELGIFDPYNLFENNLLKQYELFCKQIVLRTHMVDLPQPRILKKLTEKILREISSTFKAPSLTVEMGEPQAVLFSAVPEFLTASLPIAAPALAATSNSSGSKALMIPEVPITPEEVSVTSSEEPMTQEDAKTESILLPESKRPTCILSTY